jgi:transcriptional regulator with XRE-family HTH domain
MKQREQEEARQLREDGLSLKAIAKRLGVSPGSVSAWCRDTELSPSQKERLEQFCRPTYAEQIELGKGSAYLARVARLQFQQEGREQASKGDLLHAQGCMLYWAEGAKNRTSVEICNSNADLIKMFQEFLVSKLEVKKSDIHFRLTIHRGEDIERCKDIWIKHLDISEEQIREIALKDPSNKRKKKLPYGMCMLRLHDVKVVQHIFGAIAYYANLEHPLCLD